MPLAKRIVPCLDVDHGKVVKGVNFLKLRSAGDPVELARRYSDEGADELVFLDITASSENRETMREYVEGVARAINIPFTVGGGIRSEADARLVLCSGADKTSARVPGYLCRHPQGHGSQRPAHPDSVCPGSGCRVRHSRGRSAPEVKSL